VARDVVVEQVTREVLLVPILRAGLGLIPALQSMLPVTRVCHIGMRRDEETFQAHVYLDGLPRALGGTTIAVCDPMLATGGSLIQVVDLLKERGATDITVLCLIASAPGVEAFGALHPDVLVVTAALDETLNEKGYIVPGLGDAGDRLFGAPVRH
jgi:uracil phosphoribosyltransferase